MEKKPHTPRQTAFMAVCFFTHKPNGYPYSAVEIFEKQNRKQFDSFDFTYGKGRKLIRNESLGLLKLKRMVQHQFRGKYFGGYIVASKREVEICTFGKDGNLKEENTPTFSRDPQTDEVVLISVSPVTLFQPKAERNFIPGQFQSLGDKFRSQYQTPKQF